MPVTPERLERLMDLDLTEYEARAYLALLDLGDAQAKDVVRVGRVPKGKVYATLASLHERGLAEVIPERPKRYRPMPLRRYLRARMRELGRRLGHLASDEERLARQFQPAETPLRPPPDLGGVRSVRGRRNVAERIDRILDEHQGDVLLLLAAGGAGRFQPHLGALRDAHEGNRSLRILHAPEDHAEVQEALPAAERQATPLASRAPVDLLLVDGEVALLVHREPLDRHHYRGGDAAVELQDPALVTSLESILRTLWAPSPPSWDAPLPRRVEADLHAAPHAPDRLTRALAQLMVATLDPDGDRVRQLRQVGVRAAAPLRDRIPDAPGDRAAAVARLFRAAGLGEVGFHDGVPRLREAPGPPAWNALAEGLLAGLFPEAPRGEPPQETQG